MLFRSNNRSVHGLYSGCVRASAKAVFKALQSGSLLQTSIINLRQMSRADFVGSMVSSRYFRVMNVILKTGITAGIPTPRGDIYTIQCLHDIVAEFNASDRRSGGLIDRNRIESRGKLTHKVKRLTINEKHELLAEVELVDPDLMTKELIARPIAVSVLNDRVNVLSIRRVDVEVSPSSKHSS